MDIVTDLWEFFSQFPVYLANSLGGIIVGMNVVCAVMIITFRRSPALSYIALMLPLALYGLAWVLQWLAGVFVNWGWSGWATVFWILFSLVSLTSFFWSFVNIARLAINR